ncbi:MAG: AIR carboxylase family protein [Elusimicrobia bacterium]|nr:AIR carboxylase family protein [Elusimicrobiota bacterium]
MAKAVIIMGSKSDIEHAKETESVIKSFGVGCDMHIASAHKVPGKVLDIIKQYAGDDAVFITVAGMSNALSGFVDANTVHPVIASPPYSQKFGGMDILSSLRMPSGVCPVTVLGAAQAGLAAVKILSLKDGGLKKKIRDYQEAKKSEIENSDREIKNG